ncbi:protein shifted isoform X2 [Teleopsis dalmanni]|uniref:protein shifted isoform X2 n=1 Tax=Teleopsis dalmanni TaxID=139649 RepID=UPI0018CCA5E0|nr:protein shifted isoform X2 [Teleopsis dalmanni]
MLQTNLLYLFVILSLFWISLFECKQHHIRRNNADCFRNEYETFETSQRAGNNNKRNHPKNRNVLKQNDDEDISLWISEQQLKTLTDYAHGRIYAIENGHVVNDIRDANLYKYITIPSEISYVNFTWKSGSKKYCYHFDRLETLDDSILKAPTLSIKAKGGVPKEKKNFSVFLPCTGNNSGTAMFNIGLSIQTRRGRQLPGTPVRLSFKKECAHKGVYDSLDASNPSLTSLPEPDPECNIKCGNNGYCNNQKICQCNPGYTGQYCQTAFCFPHCLNGGNCTAPSVCTCPDGYQGTQCEGGICTEKCLNGGKCIQKDKCQCSKGYYGLRCEYSKCVIPCKNNGRCIGTNLCRCPKGLGGDHCEIVRKQRSTCKKPCKHGECLPNKTCKCDNGFHGRFCNRKFRKPRQNKPVEFLN